MDFINVDPHIHNRHIGDVRVDISWVWIQTGMLFMIALSVYYAT